METLTARNTNLPNGALFNQTTMVSNTKVMEQGECRIEEPVSCGRRRTPYEIVKIQVEDSQRVIRFLRRFFFRDEPLNICVGLLDQPGSTCVELENYCLDSIPEGVSVMAVSEDNQILGVCLSGIAARDQLENQSKNDDLDQCSNLKFKKILNLLTTVSKECDIFSRYPDVDRFLEIRVVSVDDSYRGQGIAKALFDKSKNLAKEFDLSMVRVDCTSHYSALAVSRLGFKCIYTLSYNDHLDEQGEPVFIPEPPHSCVKTFIMSLTT